MFVEFEEEVGAESVQSEESAQQVESTTDTGGPPASESAPAPVSEPAEVETSEADDTPADAAPADTSGEEDPAGSPSSEEFVEWRGEASKLKDTEWFKALPEEVQSKVEAGVLAAHKSMQGRFTQKMQEVAQARQALQDSQELVLGWMNSGAGSIEEHIETEVGQRLAEATKPHKDKVAELEQEIAGLRSGQTSGEQSFQKEIEGLKGQVTAKTEEVGQLREYIARQQAAIADGYLRAEAPWVREDQAAFDTFTRLWENAESFGLDPNDVEGVKEIVAMVEMRHKRPKREPEEVPKAEALQTAGKRGPTAEAEQPLTFQQKMRKMRTEAMG